MILEHTDACGRALQAAGLPCTRYHIWLGDDDFMHYWFGYARSLTDAELAIGARVLSRFFGSD